MSDRITLEEAEHLRLPVRPVPRLHVVWLGGWRFTSPEWEVRQTVPYPVGWEVPAPRVDAEAQIIVRGHRGNRLLAMHSKCVPVFLVDDPQTFAMQAVATVTIDSKPQFYERRRYVKPYWTATVKLHGIPESLTVSANKNAAARTGAAACGEGVLITAAQ